MLNKKFNQLAMLIQPMELHRVLPAIVCGELIQLPPLQSGSPFSVQAGGRSGIALRSGDIGGQWQATVGDVSASGPRMQLTLLLCCTPT